MKKTILNFILIVCVSWASQPPPPRMQASSFVEQKGLQDVALSPLGLHIQDTLLYTPRDIRARFGSPDSTQEQKTCVWVDKDVCKAISMDSVYFYMDKIVTFHATGKKYGLSFLEITGGRVGDLSIGMARNEIDSVFGKVEMKGGREVRTFGENDQYELWLDFESDRLVRITPDWSRASLEMLGVYH